MRVFDSIVFNALLAVVGLCVMAHGIASSNRSAGITPAERVATISPGADGQGRRAATFESETDDGRSEAEYRSKRAR